MIFSGYRRPDGKVGVRNHVLILPTVGCANETCRIIAQQVHGAVSLVNQNGCGEVAGNKKITQTVLSGLAANPNVYGTILVGLGCEGNTMNTMSDLVSQRTNKPLHTLLIQKEGGTVNTIHKALKLASVMVQEASACCREPVDISELSLAIECGGSDATSGLAANPVMGRISDSLVDAGGTTMFSETPEVIGAEHILAKRAATPVVGNKILAICARCENQLRQVGESLRSGSQPSPGNKAGGITTLEEKSLGCIHKGGNRSITEVVEYATSPRQKGLIFMDTPGYDLLSVTAKVAGGCQLVIFSTGRGNPIGNPIAPVIKVTANPELARCMSDNIDLDFSPIISGEKCLEDMGREALAEIVRVANGRLTKAETFGFGFSETVMSRLCNYI